jgi:hypothetical protein
VKGGIIMLVKSKKTLNAIIFDATNYLLLTIFAVSILYPFWNLLVISLNSASAGSLSGIAIFPKKFTLDNYRYVLRSKYIWTGYRETLIRTFWGTLLTMLFTTCGAYALSKQYLPSKKLWTIMIVIPMFFSGGLIPRYLLNVKLGLIDKRLVLITEWKLVHIIPLNIYYKQSHEIQKSLFIISFFTFTIGLVITNILSQKAYNPLKRILSTIHQHANNFGGNSEVSSEYEIINTVITGLSTKVEKLENILRCNQSTIKHNMIRNLLDSTLETIRELNEYMEILDFTFTHKFYSSAIIMLNENAMRSMSIQSQQYIKLKLIDEIEKMSDNGHKMICTQIDNNCIGIIINAHNFNDGFLDRFHVTIFNNLVSNFRVRIITSFGRWVDNPLELESSFIEAKTVLKYRLFVPAKTIILSRSLLEREESTLKIPESLIDSFEESLNTRDRNDVERCISQFTTAVINDNYSADYCIVFFTKIFYILIVKKQFFEFVLKIASGIIKSKNEVNGYREIAIFKDGVTL